MRSRQCLAPKKTDDSLNHKSHTFHAYTPHTQICGRWFDYTAHRDEDGGVVGSSWEGNLSKLDVATRILVLKRKDRRQEDGGSGFSFSS